MPSCADKCQSPFRDPREMRPALASFPGVVAHAAETLLDRVAAHALVEVRHVEIEGAVVLTHLCEQVDVRPVREPRLPEDEERNVMKEVTEVGAAPVEDRRDPVACNEDVAVQQVVVDQVALLRTETREVGETCVRLVEWTAADG